MRITLGKNTPPVTSTLTSNSYRAESLLPVFPKPTCTLGSIRVKTACRTGGRHRLWVEQNMRRMWSRRHPLKAGVIRTLLGKCHFFHTHYTTPSSPILTTLNFLGKRSRMTSHLPLTPTPNLLTITRISLLPPTHPYQGTVQFLTPLKAAQLLPTLHMNVFWRLPDKECKQCTGTSRQEWVLMSRPNDITRRNLCTTRTWPNIMGNIMANKAKHTASLRPLAELRSNITNRSVQVLVIPQPGQ